MEPLHEQSCLRGTEPESEQSLVTFREATFDGSSVVGRIEAQELFVDGYADGCLAAIVLALDLDLVVVRFVDDIARQVSMLMVKGLSTEPTSSPTSARCDDHSCPTTPSCLRFNAVALMSLG